MHVIEANNIREALPLAVDYLMNYGVREQSRLGEVLAAPTPMAIRYHYPKQHVLLNPIRDANPFFHLMEAMWMLAGREDGAFLDHYIKDFSKRFGNGGIIIDAYGYRWRHGLLFDQLDEIVTQLEHNPETRQCVLQMWGAHITPDLLSKFNKPCNLVATFRIWNEKLDITVFNRSNDLIWGCCGANAVHFPTLQEYIASKLDREIGNYWQISTNLHLYKEHIDMMMNRITHYGGETLAQLLTDDSKYDERTQPLITHPLEFDKELYEIMGWIDDIHQNKEIYRGNISNRFLCDTVLPMAMAHQCYKNKDYDNAYQHIAVVTAEDWHEAGRQWLDRRIYERRRSSTS